MVKENTDKYVLSASLFFITLWPAVTAVLWIMVFLFRFIAGWNIKLLKEVSRDKYIFLFILFYLIHIAGMIWTQDLNSGLRDLRIKLPILLFPLYFVLFRITVDFYKWICLSFCAGCITACLVCMVNAFLAYQATGDSTSFFYTSYSFLIHPQYFAMALNLAILISIDNFFKRQITLCTKTYLVIPFVIFMIINIFLLSSKMIIISTIITVPYLILMNAGIIGKTKLAFKVTLLFIAVFSGLFALYVKKYDRFTQVSEAISSTSKIDPFSQDSGYYNSSTIRITEWKLGFDLFKRNAVIGVGTGDIKNETMGIYAETDFKYGMTHFETTASQHLHMGIILGIPGMMLSLAIFIFPLVFAIRNKEFLYAGFLIMFIITSFISTVLSATGVLIYSFFNSFLYFNAKNKLAKEGANGRD